ncbi:glycosyltransferase family 4 protein [Methanoregula formicica]|uniref:Glycosyltransferase n=1 Tax=Methanoregula formicica (strain DSM 22288 / NBRC 105244 / SMSP) TaxID=593750 RepID=L0HBW0_METFS|nr:glycosyltransferase family 4 protein [Methanoregula formicica]AGB01520.1 glycosyltransferase [Methanoregula formicica SMSP]
MPEPDRMKIAFVYDVIYPYVKGGVEKRVWELSRRLAARGHEVHIFGMKYWDGDDILKKEGVIIHGICAAQPLYSHGRRTKREALDVTVHLALSLSSARVDIIDCQQFPFFPAITVRLVSTIRKIPSVITWHEVWGDYWREYLGSIGVLGKAVERFVASLKSPVISVSPTTSSRFRKEFGRQSDALLPNGIDIRHLNAITPAQESTDIIFVGRLIREKNADLLVQAIHLLVKEFPGIRLTIIGDGPERNAIATQVTNLSLEKHVRMYGFIQDHDEVIAKMKAAKVFVLPSSREGFGIAALEALGCGLPVVTIRHPANAVCDLISEENGFVCSPSPEDLAQGIRNALCNHELMQDACKASAEAYDWDHIVAKAERYYQSIAKKRAA